MKFFNFVSIATLIIIAYVAIFLPITRESDVVNEFKGPISFFFSVFVGYAISDRISRLNNIRKNDSSERSSLELLNSQIRHDSPEAYEKINNFIDEYLMATLDYSIGDYYMTRTNYDLLANAIYEIKDKDVRGDAVGEMKDILEAREQTVTLITDYLSSFEWLLYYILGVGTVIPFLLTNTGTYINMTLIIVTTVFLYLVFSFLYKLDSLEWKQGIRVFEPYQKTFLAIGKLRYFPDSLIHLSEVKKIAGSNYRVGVLPNSYPDMSGKSIKIVELDRV